LQLVRASNAAEMLDRLFEAPPVVAGADVPALRP
jgi:hypothetical protein